MFNTDNEDSLLSDAWHCGQLQWRHRDWWRSRPEVRMKEMKEKNEKRGKKGKKHPKPSGNFEHVCNIWSQISAEYALIINVSDKL